MPLTHRSESEVDNVANLFDCEVATLEEFVQARPLATLAATIVAQPFEELFVIINDGVKL